MKKLLVSLAAVGAFMLFPKVASAANGYVCLVNMYNFSGLGTSGGVRVSFYSGPSCTGALVFDGYACSASSTSNVCSSSTYYTYTERQIVGIYTQLIEAGRSGQKMYYSSSNSCRSNGTACMQEFSFLSLK